MSMEDGTRTAASDKLEPIPASAERQSREDKLLEKRRRESSEIQGLIAELRRVGCREQYKILGTLGRGKFSVVYQASFNDSLVAFKKVMIFDMMDVKTRTKCLKEIKLLKSLSHPNILRYMDSFIENNELIIILEFARGGDLKGLVRKMRESDQVFGENQVWWFFEQMVAGLSHMHSRRVMHRDLKPANIMLTSEHQVKLGDLGLGTFFTSTTMEAFSKVGTPLYMSPQVLEGKGYSFPADIWSLGCVLYELCMLRSPFKTEQQVNLYALFQQIRRGQFQPLVERYSDTLRNLVNQLLHLNPERRPTITQLEKVIIARKKAVKGVPEGELKMPPNSDRRKTRTSPFIIMEDLIDCLKELDYENKFCRHHNLPFLNKCMFAIEPPEAHTMSHYHYFRSLCSWLITLNGQDGLPSSNEPLEVAANIITALRAIGHKIDLPPSRLRVAYGFEVCVILVRLARGAIDRTKDHNARVVYSQCAAMEPIDIPDDSDDYLFLSPSSGEITTDSYYPSNDMLVDSSRCLLVSSVPTVEWQAEYKRLCDNQRLKLTPSSLDNTTSDWRKHTNLCRVLIKRFLITVEHVHPVKLSGVLESSVSKISDFETRINEEFSDMTAHIASLRISQRNLMKTFQQLSANTEHASATLCSILHKRSKLTNKLEEQKDLLLDSKNSLYERYMSSIKALQHTLCHSKKSILLNGKSQ